MLTLVLEWSLVSDKAHRPTRALSANCSFLSRCALQPMLAVAFLLSVPIHIKSISSSDACSHFESIPGILFNILHSKHFFYVSDAALLIRLAIASQVTLLCKSPISDKAP